MIPWESFRQAFEEDACPQGQRPWWPFDDVLMFKVLMLQALYLSDD